MGTWMERSEASIRFARLYYSLDAFARITAGEKMTHQNPISQAMTEYYQMLNDLQQRLGVEFCITILTESLLITLADMDPQVRQEFIPKIKHRIDQIGSNFFEDKEDYLDFIENSVEKSDE